MKVLFFGFVYDYFRKIVDFSTVETSYKSITNLILIVFSIILCYRFVYIAIGFFKKAPIYEDKEESSRFAVVIAARNEEKVIGHLLESLRKQTYDPTKITIFVVADNCTDRTASVARNLGAIVYERLNFHQISKGYALEFLFERIDQDYGILSFDYFLFFDADNLVKNTFIHEMNNALGAGFDVVTSFRNIKNFETNAISSGYGFHFYRNTLISHRPRAILGCSTNVTGTGYAVRSELLKDGWHYTDLTEDAEFSTDTIAHDFTIGYCEKAEIYDEQPTDLKTAWRQRLRWRKGGLRNFKHHSFKLFKNIFHKGSHKWSSYDMFWQTFPYDLISFVLALGVQIFGMVYSLVQTGRYDILIFLKYLGGFLLGGYLTSLGIGILVLLKERKRLKNLGFGKRILYLLLWPWFDIISIVITIQALFMRVEWKAIKHKDTRSIEEVNN